MASSLLALFTTLGAAKVIMSQDSCPVTQYTGGFKAAEHVLDHALLGHSYKNITTTSANGCSSACVMDCRCVSYQLSDTHCELMDEDRHTAPSNFTARPGYKYYELNQRFIAQVKIQELYNNLPQSITDMCWQHDILVWSNNMHIFSVFRSFLGEKLCELENRNLYLTKIYRFPCLHSLIYIYIHEESLKEVESSRRSFTQSSRHLLNFLECVYQAM